MSRYDFDLFTLGAGSGGVAGSRRAASYGARVGICEEQRVGGTCVLRGCVPKKLLVYASHFSDAFEDAGGFGWTVIEPHFDWPTLIGNKDRELDRLNGIYLRLLRESGAQLFDGRGRLVDRHTVEVAGRRITAERILLATGSHPILPNIVGIEHAITSNEALSLPSLPRRIAIVGGGYIAVEFAGIFAGLGVEVALLLRGDAVLRGFDHDLRDGLAGALRNRGVTLHTHTHVTQIEKTTDSLSLATAEGERVVADVVLYATGRRPNTTGIGLEEIGIATGPNGAILVDEWSETNIPGIYAVGDVTDRLTLTPVAIAEARALVETLFHDNPTKFDTDLVPTAVFSTPSIATVGLSEEAARSAGHAVDVYRTRFRPMKHTLSGRNELVMLKLVVDRDSDRVLGCHMLGDDAPEIIQGLAIALKCGATKKLFDQTVGIHPTSAEEFVTMQDKI